ncbi:alpha/beta fold hydrolase [Quadrisphaera sp. INWT6]|uniref:alpha/beta fold hydrolase n=1 Tax=Quadrisphaera sp. INWT6 TaxID=2596917 RepID=UPI002107CDB6|nr:alpha/beta hydrolase [Quadrisphaera sp. INWT6]
MTALDFPSPMDAAGELMHPAPPVIPHDSLGAGGPAAPAQVLARHHVTEHGDPNGPVLLLAHGFGAGQGAWGRLLPHFPRHRIITFDHAGSGATDIADFDHDRHGSLTGYAEDVLAICAALDLHQVTYVGHSVSSMIGVLAAAAEPDRFASLVLVAPSARYIDDPGSGYIGGFSYEDITELLTSLDSNYYAWSSAMAPVVMGTPDTPELGAELTKSFLGTHPDAARTFARAIFLSDTRAVLPRIAAPVLVLQCRHDALAPEAVGQSVATALPAGELVHLTATGHCPHVSAPAETAAAIHHHLLTRPERPGITELTPPTTQLPAPRQA